ncbi:MAG TPA: hypothetical protein VFS20_11770 [Longimicrobium sp.]|nr:hypothetical protein [Longimicrobium sp.]
MLVELGYALRALGDRRVLIVFNTAFGSVGKLPFDLRGRQVITYCMAPDQEDRADERRNLEHQLHENLRDILQSQPVALGITFEDGSILRRVYKDNEHRFADERDEIISQMLCIGLRLQNNGSVTEAEIDCTLILPSGLEVLHQKQAEELGIPCLCFGKNRMMMLTSSAECWMPPSGAQICIIGSARS